MIDLIVQLFERSVYPLRSSIYIDLSNRIIIK